MGYRGYLLLVLPVVDQPVICIGCELSLNEGRGGRDSYQIRHEGPHPVEHGHQVLLIPEGHIDLEGLDVEPAVLADVEEPVVDLVVLLLLS